MEKKYAVLITFFALVFLIVGLYMFTDWFSRVTGYFVGEQDTEKLAQCLAGKNAEFYYSQLCADCEKQKNLFGASFKHIQSTNCGNDKSLCPNIKSLPAFYLNQTIIYGYKNLTELDTLSGCDVID